MNRKFEITPDEIKNCPIYKTMQIFQGKWNAWILFELEKNETMRFGELKKAIPEVSSTVLSNALKDLEERKLIERRQFNEIPPHVEYSATQNAKDLHEIFEAMWKWGETHIE